MTWTLPLASVLVPYDFSPACDEALRVARTMVSDDAQICALYVTHEPSATDPAAIWGHVSSEGALEKARASLAKAMLRVGIQAKCAVILGTGGPGDEIAEYGDEHKVELIVMPSNARTGLSRILLGSVTERVMRLAHAPVLVVRPTKAG